MGFGAAAPQAEGHRTSPRSELVQFFHQRELALLLRAPPGCQEFADRSLGKHCLDLRHGLIQFGVQRAQPHVIRQAQWAALDPSDGADRIEHFQHGDFVGIATERHASSRASLGGDDPGVAQTVYDLAEIRGADLGGLGHLRNRAGEILARCQMGNRPQCVIRSLRKQENPLSSAN